MSNQMLSQANAGPTSSVAPTVLMMNSTQLTFPSNAKINQIVSMTPVSSTSSPLPTSSPAVQQVNQANATIAYSMSSPSSSSSSSSSTSSSATTTSTTTTANNLTAVSFSVSSPSNSINSASNSASNTSGFANCSHCGMNGVKAAFYGKSKLYCSVACQNGKKLPSQQQQQQQGVKRTLDALNYNTQPQTISVINPNHSGNTIQITAAPSSTTTNIPTLIPTSNFYTITTTPTPDPNIQFQTLTPAPPTVFQTTFNSATSAANIINETKTIKTILPQLTTLTTDKSLELEPKQTDHSESNGLHDLSPHLTGNAAKRPRKSSTTNLNQSSNKLSSSISSTIDEVLKKNLIETTNLKSNESVPTSNNKSSSQNKIKNMPVGQPVVQQQQMHQSSPALSQPPPQQTQIETENIPVLTSSSVVQNNFDWPSYMEQNKAEAAPVSLFKHVPLCSLWRKIYGIVVEAPNIYLKDQDQVYNWFAVVIKCAGYYVKLRYVGYEDHESEDDFWMHICDKKINHVGYSKTVSISLVPPEKISNRIDDWKSYLFEKLPRYVTLPKSFRSIVDESLKSRFERNMLLELVDKNELSKMRVAKVLENVGGRLRLKYENSSEFTDFWCHENSPVIHPIGWSVTVGHEIANVSEDYKRNSTLKYASNKYEKNECSKFMFSRPPNVSLQKMKSKMKLEAVDPLTPSKIRVATVSKILNDNYIMVKFDRMKEGIERSLEFCYHRTSSSIFHAGFSRTHGLELEKPFEYTKKFTWEKYLEETNSEFAPEDLFFKGVRGFMNPFKIGMKLESVDLVEPRLVCPATVVAIAGRLIRINFDGWTKDFDQWIDCESCDVYPIGWCQLVNYQLELPNGFAKEAETIKKNMKKSSKKK